ncbi:hypothetical protein SAMN03159353_10692 [Cedecea sp. NFIX57]|nr:hypothetical protein SAMN03159353_10692 [Cedecea sp. NFIX57]
MFGGRVKLCSAGGSEIFPGISEIRRFIVQTTHYGDYK